jgi:integrase
MNTNEFMLQLQKRLCEKTYGNPPRNIGDTTANAYIKTLYRLNDNQPFKNLAFLKKTDEILKKLSAYAESTQKTLVSTLASVLSLDKDKSGYKTVYKFYYDKMMEKSKAAEAEDTSKKTTKQEENWIEWDKVLEKYNELRKTVLDKKKAHWGILPLMVLSLYTEIPPRRNQDYLKMVVIRTTKKTKLNELPADKNYLVLGGRGIPLSFIFNIYKTSKTYGRQVINIPETLKPIIKLYIKNHPNAKDKEFPFLVADGVPITADNAITRVLNKIFGKNVGSSMLRHIYLSSKYNINDMTNDATQMAHSLPQQKDYLKGHGTDQQPLSSVPAESESEDEDSQ